MFLAAFRYLKSTFVGLKSGFWHFFQKWRLFFKHSILIICHGGHFSFFKLFLKVAKYTWSAKSWNHFLIPIDLHFFRFLLCIDFLKLYLEKTIEIAVVDNVKFRTNKTCYKASHTFPSFSSTLAGSSFSHCTGAEVTPLQSDRLYWKNKCCISTTKTLDTNHTKVTVAIFQIWQQLKFSIEDQIRVLDCKKIKLFANIQYLVGFVQT